MIDTMAKATISKTII